MRGCFGGCSFCSITEHEGRIIQNRSQESIINELEEIRDKVPGFTGTISDLGTQQQTCTVLVVAIRKQKQTVVVLLLACSRASVTS
ncbi:radical SAM protein [Vibrio harveyi]|nr:radical SAM protein [Vibrio harveyi]